MNGIDFRSPFVVSLTHIIDQTHADRARNQMNQTNGRLKLLLALASLSALGPLSIDFYLPGFPAMSSDLGVPIGTIQMSLAAFFIGISIGQLFYGPWTDRVGRKKPLYIGLVLYIVSSIAIAFTQSAEGLIFWRLVQAFGGCAGLVIARAVVRDAFPIEETARVFSILMLITGVAPILAPTFGGLMTEWFGWRSIFITLAILSSLSLLMVHYVLPETGSPNRMVSYHPATVFKSYLEVFREPSFVTYVFMGGTAAAGMFAYISASPYVFMEKYGLSETIYGWIFGMNAFGLIAASQVNRYWLRRRHGSEIIMRASTMHALVASALLVLTLFGHPPLPYLLVLVFAYLALLGFIFPNSAALTLVPFGKNAGAASALMGSVQMVLGALMASIVSGFHNQTVYPMLIGMACCALLSYSTLLLGTRRIR